MKVIFLDIDGVLNTINTFKKRYEYWQKTNIWTLEIDEFRVKSLKEIVNKTNAKIVLSSSWRCFWSLENETLIPLNDKAREFTNLLKKYNLDIYSITPYDKNRIRQKEINQWLNNHNDIESFVILDDESYDLMGLSEYLIKTTKGLGEKQIINAINILNKSNDLIRTKGFTQM